MFTQRVAGGWLQGGIGEDDKGLGSLWRGARGKQLTRRRLGSPGKRGGADGWFSLV